MVFLDRVINLCCAHGKETISTLTNKDGKNDVEEKPTAASSKPDAPVVEEPKAAESSEFSDKNCKYVTVDYKDLSKSLQQAVITLGFTQETWDAGEWPSIAHVSFSDMTAEQKAAAEELGWSAPAWDDEYESTSWKDLPDTVQKAASSAGFSEEIWDGDKWPESLHKKWSDLTVDQKRAMNVLGYTRWDWE